MALIRNKLINDIVLISWLWAIRPQRQHVSAAIFTFPFVWKVCRKWMRQIACGPGINQAPSAEQYCQHICLLQRLNEFQQINLFIIGCLTQSCKIQKLSAGVLRPDYGLHASMASNCFTFRSSDFRMISVISQRLQKLQPSQWQTILAKVLSQQWDQHQSFLQVSKILPSWWNLRQQCYMYHMLNIVNHLLFLYILQ